MQRKVNIKIFEIAHLAYYTFIKPHLLIYFVNVLCICYWLLLFLLDGQDFVLLVWSDFDTQINF